ncbi:hypothetical protein AAVH_15142 [Aphelenchoides avenae]|nr:hypothetical protein AAVH_15142 [Aphelenchus avenae]
MARNAGDTRADVAAGVVFHSPCDTRDTYYDPYHHDDFCTTQHYDYNYTAFAYLGSVEVGRADVLSQRHTATLNEKGFTRKDVHYRIQDGDVVKFTIMNEWNESYAGKCEQAFDQTK